MWFLGRTAAGRQPSVAANVAVRLIQVHFAIVMIMSGLHKLQFGEWWGGFALWYPLYPPLSTTLEEAREHVADRASYMTMLSIGTYAVLTWQIGFPLFAWRPRLRLLLIGGALIGWLGSAFLYDVPTFGPALLVCSLSFLIAAEWDWPLLALRAGILRHTSPQRQQGGGLAV